MCLVKLATTHLADIERFAENHGFVRVMFNGQPTREFRGYQSFRIFASPTESGCRAFTFDSTYHSERARIGSPVQRARYVRPLYADDGGAYVSGYHIMAHRDDLLKFMPWGDVRDQIILPVTFYVESTYAAGYEELHDQYPTIVAFRRFIEPEEVRKALVARGFLKEGEPHEFTFPKEEN